MENKSKLRIENVLTNFGRAKLLCGMPLSDEDFEEVVISSNDIRMFPDFNAIDLENVKLVEIIQKINFYTLPIEKLQQIIEICKVE